MHILVIGGTGFIGRQIVRELIRTGHRITVVHRGRSPVPPEAHGIVADRRRLSESAHALRALAPEVVLDVVLSSGRQARELTSIFRGHAGRVVAVSSMNVYRACGVTHGLEDGPPEPLPLTENTSALRTKLQTYPAEQVRMLQRIFGWLDDEYDKIPVEREILAHDDLPGTVLRLPMVYGPGDPLRRFYPIVKRVLGCGHDTTSRGARCSRRRDARRRDSPHGRLGTRQPAGRIHPARIRLRSRRPAAPMSAAAAMR